MAKLLTYSPRLPILWDSGFSVADFVAIHSCEGSGGIAPLFPYTSGASWLSKRGQQRAQKTLRIPVKHSEFQSVERRLFYEAEGEEWVEAMNGTAKIQTPSISYVEDRGRLKSSLFAAQVIAAVLKLDAAITLMIISARRHPPFPGAYVVASI